MIKKSGMLHLMRALITHRINAHSFHAQLFVGTQRAEKYKIVRKLKPTEKMHSFRWFNQHYFKVSIKKVFIFVTKIII